MMTQMKILMVGMPESGKTSILQRLTLDEFSDEYHPTTSSDFSIQEFTIDDNLTVTTQIWDIGGATPIGKAFSKNLNGVVLVFDVTLLGRNLDDLEHLEDAYNKVLSIPGASSDTGPLFPFLIVMNKVDLLSQGENFDLAVVVKWLLAKNVANPESINIMACSAKTGYNVAEVFETIIKSVLSYKPSEPTLPNISEPAKPISRRGSRVRSSIVASMVDTSILADLKTESTSMQVISAKIVLVGSAGCGKTSLLSKFLDESKELNINYEPTVGTDLRVKNLVVKDKIVSLQLWDSAGNKSAVNIGRAIYKNADGALLMYDVTSRESFDELNFHWENFMKYANPEYIDDYPILLVGMKSDLVGGSDTRPVTMEEVLNWCSEKRPGAPVTYIEASALHGIGVRDVFICMADFVLENYSLAEEYNSDDDVTDYDDDRKQVRALGADEYYDIEETTVNENMGSVADDQSSYYDDDDAEPIEKQFSTIVSKPEQSEWKEPNQPITQNRDLRGLIPNGIDAKASPDDEIEIDSDESATMKSVGPFTAENVNRTKTTSQSCWTPFPQALDVFCFR